MKSTILLMLIVFGSFSAARAQTWDEWFRQRATQKKYLLQQIAALKVYAGYLEKGYRIAQQGLGSIGEFIGGEFDLHRNYFTSLKEINPAIARYPRASDIRAIDREIRHLTEQSYSDCSHVGLFTTAELHYIRTVHGRLLDDCAAIVEDLDRTLASNALQMKDEERIARIDELFGRMQDNYTFCKSFTSHAKLLAIARAKNQMEIETSRKLFGINH